MGRKEPALGESDLMSAHTITFSLPKPYALPNTYLGRNRFALARHRQKTRNIVWYEARHLVPPAPFQKARIEIERWSVGTPDADNLTGGAKALIDCLTTPVPCRVKTPGARPRMRNKNGLGFVVDDSPRHVVTLCKSVKCRRCEQKTVVTITDLGGP